MNDIVILHLSDLHIDSKGKSYSKLLKDLLSDIKTQVASILNKNLVIVVTGDIINMGDCGALSNAKKFFKQLEVIVHDKVKAIYIVPGNHDKKRTKADSFLLPAYRGLIHESPKKIFDQEFKEELWLLQEKTYNDSGYTELIEYIYNDLFKMADIGKIAKNTYGVHVLEIDDKRYCFVMLNTAWSCFDEFDGRKLILGNFQMDEISSQFHDLTDEEMIDMTFVMGHHPIECLYGIEQDKLFSHMISYTEMSANIYLCGHTHDRNVINWSNNRHAIHTLMTGFGWPETPNERVHDHYYSIYLFNLDLNSMDIFVRKTNDGSEFIPDLSIYTGKSYFEKDKLVRPIRFQEAQGEIILSSAKGTISKTIYASTDFLQYSKYFLSTIYEISLSMGALIESYKKDLFDNLVPIKTLDKNDEEMGEELLRKYWRTDSDISELSEEEHKIVSEIMKQNSSRIYDNFQSFIQRLCQKFHEGLVQKVEKGQIVRFHFRYLSDKSAYIYSTLCSSFSLLDESLEEENQPTDIKYGDLLEATFTNPSSGCLIYSVNEEVCSNKLKDKWQNFITIVPKFENNIYNKRVNKSNSKQYPFLTFGVTINDCSHEEILQCMDFYAMDEYIGDLLQMYSRVFIMNIEAFLSWLKQEDKEDKMEAKENESL